MNQNKKKKRPQNLVPSAVAEEIFAKVLVIVALPEEREYFHSVLKAGRANWSVPHSRTHFNCNYLTANNENIRVVLRTLTGMGHLEASLGVSSAIYTIKPQFAILVGIAGSLQPQTVTLGDVIVSNQVKYYGSDKVFALKENQSDHIFVIKDGSAKIPKDKNNIYIDSRDKFMNNSILRYERNVIKMDYIDDLLSELEPALKGCSLISPKVDDLPKELPERSLHTKQKKVHMGWLLASNHVVDSQEYRDYLVYKNDDLDCDIHKQKGEGQRVKWEKGQLLAVDMESYGFLRALDGARIPSRSGGISELQGGVVVRGVSDLCVEKSTLDKASKEAIREIAAKNATEVALTLIENLDYSSMLR